MKHVLTSELTSEEETPAPAHWIIDDFPEDADWLSKQSEPFVAEVKVLDLVMGKGRNGADLNNGDEGEKGHPWVPM